MPTIGDKIIGYDIGLKNNHWFIYSQCELCHKARWVFIYKGLPKSKYCQICWNTILVKEVGHHNQGVNNGYWKGDAIGIHAVHRWIQTHKVKPDYCECCHKNKPYDLANISGKYNREINDFEWLCRKCHMEKDGRMNNLKQFKNGYRVNINHPQINQRKEQELNWNG